MIFPIWSLYVGGGMIGISILIFFILIFRAKFIANRTHIDDYQKKRDQITPKAQDEKVEEVNGESDSFIHFIPKLVSAFVILLVGISLLGPIRDQIATVTTNSSSDFASTGAMQTMLALVPGFFLIALIIPVIVIVFAALRKAGMI